MKNKDFTEEQKKLQEAAQPLVDYLNKNGCPHDYIVVTQASAELLNSQSFIKFEPID